MFAVIFVQTYIINRSYAIPEYTVERERHIEYFVNDLINNALYTDTSRNFSLNLFEKVHLNEISDFEDQNSVNLVIFDKNLNNVKVTENTKSKFSSYYIDYIRNKIENYNLSIHYYPDIGNRMPIFRIYNKYHLPTKYIVFESTYAITKTDYIYVAAIIPEVFTSESSKMLEKYALYVFAFLLLLIFAVSIIFAYLVAKPILKINRTASKIAELNFDERCEIKSESEIGNLSKTINTLSQNLENTLNKLYAANEKLQKDLDLQKELDYLRKEFLGAVTHELKTPITLIKGYTESIKDDIAKGEDREMALETIIEETENMDKLVKDLLDLSKLESIGYKLNISEFYIDQLLTKVINKYQNAIKEKGINLITNVFQDILVKGDKFRIEQVLCNFMNNAIDNTPENGRITLSLDSMFDSVMICIENQGKNIDETEINRIWEKFYRVEKSRNKKFGGTGLGLAISKSILALHNSKFGAKNVKGGVMFFFTLDVAEKLEEGS